MDEQQIQNTVYVLSQIVCASIEALAMHTANLERMARAESQAYNEDAINGLIEKYSIHHNAVLTQLRGW